MITLRIQHIDACLPIGERIRSLALPHVGTDVAGG